MALHGTIPTGKDIPVLKDTIILIATHLLLAPHRLYQRPSALAAENTVLCEETEGARASRVVCHLDELLAARGMTLVELSEKVGVTTVNLSVLKNDRAEAIRRSTLSAICEALGCSVGELLEVVPD